MHKIGAITVGQSPRDDIVPDMKRILGESFEIIECGALDGLSPREIQLLAPGDDDHIVVSRRRDGSAVTLAKKHVSHRLQRCIDQLEKRNVKLIALLGTANFPELKSTKLLIQPSNLLQRMAISMIEKGRISVVTPLKKQCEQTRRKWEHLRVDVVVDHALPYASEDQIIAVAQRIVKENVDLIVLDCIGFNVTMKRSIRMIVKKPILLPITLLARIIAELVTS
ncbi:MAG: AroM family protein [Candidatus Bathyarchaeota archaeon]|nr:MAG: AroM family protein [Candidatus Bathyarchaeota archaeon]